MVISVKDRDESIIFKYKAIEQRIAEISKLWKGKSELQQQIELKEVMPLFRDALGMPERFDETLEEFQKGLNQGKKIFLDAWAKALSNYEDPCNYAPKLLEIAASTVEGVSINSGLFAALASDDWDGFFDFFDFENKKQNGEKIYHVDVNQYANGSGDSLDIQFTKWISSVTKDGNGWCWQQFGGYTDLYDGIFDVFCNMDTNKEIVFQTKSGEAYTIWLWKGDYLNLGSGGECGFYKGNAQENILGIVSAATDHEIPMTMSIDYGDGKDPTYYDAGDTWWATSFNSNRHVKAEDITITYTVDFSEQDPLIFEAFKDRADEIQKVSNSKLQIQYDEKSKIATIIY